MTMNLITPLTYWVVVAVWTAVLGMIGVYYSRNPQIYGTTRLLLSVVAVDTIRNIVENVYFGLFFGSRYGLFPPEIAETLGNPSLLIVPKLINIVAGIAVLGLLILTWLPRSERERKTSDNKTSELEKLATTDGMTELSNRRQFDKAIKSEFARYQRYGRPLSLLLIDVDHFKTVNDRLGHEAGDTVLKAIANLCAGVRRESDLVARIGGEEFAILLPETDESAALVVAERLRGLIESNLKTLNEMKLNITVSIGVAAATFSMASSAVLLKQADSALYRAKNNGRNQISWGHELVHLPRTAAE